MSSVTPTQHQVLLELTGLAPPNGRRHKRPTLEVLHARGLINLTGAPTGLGQVAARLDGWVPNDAQQELIIALADGEVAASNAYHLGGDWSRAPAQVLRKLRDSGVAVVATPGRLGRYTATNLGHQLALFLRQQTLPPR